MLYKIRVMAEVMPVETPPDVREKLDLLRATEEERTYYATPRIPDAVAGKLREIYLRSRRLGNYPTVQLQEEVIQTPSPLTREDRASIVKVWAQALQPLVVEVLIVEIDTAGAEVRRITE